MAESQRNERYPMLEQDVNIAAGMEYWMHKLEKYEAAKQGIVRSSSRRDVVPLDNWDEPFGIGRVIMYKNSGAKVVFSGNAKFNLIGPSNLEWDKVLIVEYASKKDFLNMITTEGYPAKMRKIALEDSRLIFCVKN